VFVQKLAKVYFKDSKNVFNLPGTACAVEFSNTDQVTMKKYLKRKENVIQPKPE
jgi:hypothetical protein